MDPGLVERWVRDWLARHHPSESTPASMNPCAAGRVWADLDRIDQVSETGADVVVRFTWSLHRESEFTVHDSDGDATVVRTETAEVRFARDGTER